MAGSFGKSAWSPRKIQVRLLAGASMNFDAAEYVALVSSDGDLEMAPEGENSFVPLGIRRGFGVPGHKLGKVTVRNATGSTVTGVIITGNGAYLDFQAYTSTSPLAVTLAHDPLPVLAKGTEADAAAVASNPLLIASKSADGKVRTNAADVEGRQVVIPAIPADMVDGSQVFVAAGALDIIATPGAGKRLIVGTLVLANDGIVDDTAIILDDATEKFRVALLAGTSLTIPFGPGMKITTNKALKGNVVVGGGSFRMFASATIITP